MARLIVLSFLVAALLACFGPVAAEMQAGSEDMILEVDATRTQDHLQITPPPQPPIDLELEKRAVNSKLIGYYSWRDSCSSPLPPYPWCDANSQWTELTVLSRKQGTRRHVRQESFTQQRLQIWVRAVLRVKRFARTRRVAMMGVLYCFRAATRGRGELLSILMLILHTPTNQENPAIPIRCATPSPYLIRKESGQRVFRA